MKTEKKLIVLVTLGLLLVSCGIHRSPTANSMDRSQASNDPKSNTPSSGPVNGWEVGSGGESFTNEKYPWFLGNDTSVFYCIEQGKEFSLSKEKSESLIQEAIVEWVKTLEYMELSDKSVLFVEGKKQSDISRKFALVPCGPSVELTIKLGTMDKMVENL